MQIKKILVIGGIGIVIAGSGGAGFYFFETHHVPVANPNNQLKVLSANVLNLQHQVGGLQQSVNNLNPMSTQSAVGEATHERLAAIESSITNLQNRIKALEHVLPVKLSNSTGKRAPMYIPFGTNGSATSIQYTILETPQVAIDPADYPGYTSMQLEVSLKLAQGNGKAYAQMYEVNEKLFMPDSEVSTSNQNFDLLTSKAFGLPSGKKTYRIALKTLTGAEVDFQDAKIRVNY